jgi:RecB family exonuclease
VKPGDLLPTTRTGATARLRLHRAPTLQAFRHTLIRLLPQHDVEQARGTAVIVPTRSAAALLQRTIEDQLEPGQAVVLPDLLTRRDWYDRLAERAAQPPLCLGSYERDVLMEAAAHAAITDGATPPFHLRSALIGEVVGLYDAVRRQRQDVASFERLVLEPLALEAESEGDAGAERMLRQTRFLAATFRGYEARRQALGALDEHALREWLIATPLARPYRTLIVAVADETRDGNGLWNADFDLMTRLPDVQVIDIVATEAMLDTGLFERLHDLLPGLVWGQTPTSSTEHPEPNREFLEHFDTPRLLVPVGPTHTERRLGSDPKPYFVSRDREEELRDLLRRIRTVQRDDHTRVPLGRIGVVFDRPLPYIYLAREVFAQGHVPFDARDALPLAAEPFAAAVDLVLSCAAAQFSRQALIALLVSPHLRFTTGEGHEIDRLDVAALDAALEESDHRGDADRLEALADGWTDGTLRSPFGRWDVSAAARAAKAGAAAIRDLTPLATVDLASVQLGRLGGFLNGHRRIVGHDDPLGPRLLRAQQAVLAIIAGLAQAHRAHHDLLWTLADLAADLRHRIEGETFTPDTGEPGVQLVDAAAAPFGSFDALHLVGLVGGEWPRRHRRNSFYSPGLLTALGWPAEQTDRLAPARAMFVDLLQSPARHVSVSTFSLEDDALVEPSSLLDDIARAGLTAIPLDVADVRVFEDEVLAFAGSGSRGFDAAVLAVAGSRAGFGAADSFLEDALDEETAQWAVLRASRLAATLPRFHGTAGAQTPRGRSVSALELYAQCPFKFYSRYVLRLVEERDDDEGLSPLERGRMHHELFEAIFATWQSRGHGTVTPELLDQARTLALETMDVHLARLSPVDAALERTRLVGSPVAPGLIDVVLRLEAERPIKVVERRLEHKIDGIYRFAGTGGTREIEVRGIVDRIDLLADGTFRVLDYKASRPGSTLQIALYATCVRQKLRGYRGRDWELAEAAYVAFRGDKTVVPLAARPADNDEALAHAEREVVAIVDAIARGEFPPRPRSRSLCQTCAFAAVCRKDYVDADDAAPAL